MRIAALYDIHGNLPALEAVLDEVVEAGVDLIVVGGDVVPGPMPVDVLDLLAQLPYPTRYIRGNGETDVLALRAGVEPSRVPEQHRAPLRWSAARLRPEHERLLADWPMTCRAASEPFGQILFCHATPRSDNEIITRNTSESDLAPVFRDAGASLVVCGHTHMQFDRHVGDVRVVNAGSVGMPFGDAGAYWLLIDSDAQLRYTTFDFEDAARRIRATKYPGADEFAMRNVLRPPSAAAMLAVFDQTGRGGT